MVINWYFLGDVLCYIFAVEFVHLRRNGEWQVGMRKVLRAGSGFECDS